jgi:putative ABC transport system permease protein
MHRIRALLARLAAALRRAPDQDAELREELEAHLEMEIAEYVRRGMTPRDARRRALLASGGLTQAAEAVHEQRGLPWIEELSADVRYAFRTLRRAPGFTAVVVLTLALGVGANTAIFSVVRGVLLKALPHRDGDRLVYLRHAMDGLGGASIAFSVPEVRDLRDGARSLDGIAEFSEWSLRYRRTEGTTRIETGLVTGNYFDVMGLAPVLGRLTRPSDDGPAAAPVMVLTHDWWMKEFGGDTSVVGKTLVLDGRAVEVIGVVQRAPFHPGRPVALLNMAISQHHLSAQMVEGRTHRMTEVVARLAPGATLAQARDEVAAVMRRMQEEHREAYDPGSHHRVAVVPFHEVLGEAASLTLWLLMGAAAFVLVISAANVANLTLMRGVRREQELVVRTALGAGAGRLRRLLLVENLLLALGGAAVGLGIALGGVRLLTSLAERYSPRAGEIALDGVVFAFLLAISVGVALVLSLLATLPREGSIASWVASGTRRVSGNRRRQRLQRALVVAQVAVSIVLLAGAGLLTRTMVRLSQVETGLRSEELLTLQVALLTPQQLLTDPMADVAAKARYDRMRDEIAGLPGVVDVGIGSPTPLRSSDVRFEVKAEGKPLAAGEATPRAEMRVANPAFFRAAGIPLLGGRAFASTDTRGSASVVIVNRTLADQLFPGEDPVGKRLAWTGDILRFTPFTRDWRTIVGVVANTQDGGLDAEPRAAVYMPFAQELSLSGGFVIRADSNVARLVPAVMRIVRRGAPTSPIENVMTVAQIRELSVAPRRLNAALVSSFGILAVLIAAVGIAGVLAFSVSARTNEIGIRMSLGADGGRVQRMILREGSVLLVIGVVVGVGGAFAAGRAIRGLLFGVTPHDPATFAVVAALMVAIGLGACWIPAHRASRIDPATAMRA